MKTKKLVWIILGALVLIFVVLAFVFKPMTMSDVYDEPHFSGTVIEVSEKSLLILVDEGEDERKSSDKISVSLDVKLKDSMTLFNVDDHVKVFYDGKIAESYPAQIHTVYAIFPIND